MARGFLLERTVMEELEQKLNYVFRNPALLSEADKVEITEEGAERVDARAGRAFERSLAVHL